MTVTYKVRQWRPRVRGFLIWRARRSGGGVTATPTHDCGYLTSGSAHRRALRARPVERFVKPRPARAPTNRDRSALFTAVAFLK